MLMTVLKGDLAKGLRKNVYDDFCKEYPKLNINFKQTGGIFHDRYIIIDYNTDNEKIFHCGASSKDAGSRVCFKAFRVLYTNGKVGQK